MRAIGVVLALIAWPGLAFAEGGTSTTATRAAAPTRTASVASPPSRAGVVYHNETILYLAASAPNAGVDRAKRASRALATALEAKGPSQPGAPSAEVRAISSSTIALYVRGYFISEIQELDAHAAGYPTLQAYAKDLEDGVGLFVSDQLRRRALQGFALRALFAVIIGLAGLISIRVLARAFDRADDFIYERRASLPPLTILRVPIVSQETLGAGVTFALAIGRVVAYVAVTVATASLILAQFDATRAWVGRAIAWGSAPMLAAVEVLAGAIPGIVLAAALLVALKAALRVIGLLLDSLAQGREPLRGITPERVRVLRILLPIGAVIVVAPLIVAAAFGSFHSPLEIVAIAIAAAGAFGVVPLAAAAIVGFAMLWRHAIRVGEWIEIGGVQGRVVEVSPWEIAFERGADARVVVPMLALLFRPMRRSVAPPRATLELVAQNDRPLREILRAVERAIHEVDAGAELNCLGFSAAGVVLRIETASANLEIRQALILALSDAKDVRVLEARIGP
jgi:small-conductance mechanosensitive channel